MSVRKGFRSLLAGLAAGLCLLATPAAQAGKKEFTTEFNLGSCTFLTEGRNPYFILVPDYRLTLEGLDDKEEVEVQITVLPDVQAITVPGLGTVNTRVVEEREWVDGMIDEVSRNFFALCEQTNDVYYFGEDVDDYEDGQIVSHEGGWRAGVDGAVPGLIMPGTFLLGARYYQEIAPGVALDRAKHIAMGLTRTVPAGTYSDVVKIMETSGLESGKEYKYYARGVGLIVDEGLQLVDVFEP